MSFEEIPKTGHTILVVDDDETMARTLLRALTRHGHQCFTALNGDQGLKLIHETRFDLILTDLVMPGFDGVTFVRTVKSIDSNIPIIMMTGYGSVDTAVEAMKAGAYDYLTKPFEVDELRLVVKRALEKLDLEQENRDLKRQLFVAADAPQLTRTRGPAPQVHLWPAP